LCLAPVMTDQSNQEQAHPPTELPRKLQFELDSSFCPEEGKTPDPHDG